MPRKPPLQWRHNRKYMKITSYEWMLTLLTSLRYSALILEHCTNALRALLRCVFPEIFGRTLTLAVATSLVHSRFLWQLCRAGGFTTGWVLLQFVRSCYIVLTSSCFGAACLMGNIDRYRNLDFCQQSLTAKSKYKKIDWKTHLENGFKSDWGADSTCFEKW